MSGDTDNEYILRILPKIRELIPDDNASDEDFMLFIKSPMFKEMFPSGVHHLIISSTVTGNTDPETPIKENMEIQNENIKKEVTVTANTKLCKVTTKPVTERVDTELTDFHDDGNLNIQVHTEPVRSCSDSQSIIFCETVDQSSLREIEVLTLDSDTDSDAQVGKPHSYTNLERLEPKSNSEGAGVKSPKTEIEIDKASKNFDASPTKQNYKVNSNCKESQNNFEKQNVLFKNERNDKFAVAAKTKDPKKIKKASKLISSSSSASGVSSNSRAGRKRKHQLKKQERKRIKLMVTSDSEESLCSITSNKVPMSSPQTIKRCNTSEKVKTERENKKKRKHESSDDAEDVERSILRELKKMSKADKKSKPSKSTTKPFSLYSKSRSTIVKGKDWTPYTHPKFLKMQKRKNLKVLTVPCVDLLHLETFFHRPGLHGPPTCLTSKPLKKTVMISKEKAINIVKMEKLKVDPFKRDLDRLYAKRMGYKSVKQKPKNKSNNDPKNKRLMTFDFLKNDTEQGAPVKSTTNHKERSIKMEPKNNSEKKLVNTGKKSLTVMPMTKDKSILKVEVNQKSKSSGEKLPIVVLSSNSSSSPVDLFNNCHSRTIDKPKKVHFLEQTQRNQQTLNAQNGFKNREMFKYVESRPIPRQRALGPSKLTLGPSPQARLRVQPSFNEPVKNKKRKLRSRLDPRLSPHMTARVDKVRAEIEYIEKQEASSPSVPLISPTKTSNNRPMPEIPVPDIVKGSLPWDVKKVLSKNTSIELPVMPSQLETGYEMLDYTCQKVAWWFLKNDKDPADMVMVHPELHDNDMIDKDYQSDQDFDWMTKDDDDSSIGSVSGDGDSPIFYPGATKEFHNPDRLDDYCGLACLEAKIRMADTQVKDDSLRGFFRFIVIKTGTNYEKDTFEAKCLICNKRILGQRRLGAHVRGESHKNEFKNYSLKLANYEESSIKLCPADNFKAQLKTYSTADMGQLCASLCEITQSKSPLNHQNGDSCVMIASHLNQKTPESNLSEDSLPNFELYRLSQDNQQQDAKLALRLEGKWNDDLERSWKKMLEEEERLKKQYDELREKHVESPTDHPNFEEEWLKYWNRRCSELDSTGIDSSQYDFGPEWSKYWFSHMQEIMKEQAEKKIADMKKKFGVDVNTLRDLKHQRNPGFQRYAHRVPGISRAPRRPLNSNYRGRGNRSRPNVQRNFNSQRPQYNNGSRNFYHSH